MFKHRIATRKSGGWKQRIGALAALSLVAGCERAQPDSADGTTPDAVARPAPADGELVLEWNTFASEVALAADSKYEDPFVHLRALTMLHLAMHDAANGVDQKYGVVLRAYYSWPAGRAPVSTWLAVANNAQYAADTPEGLELTIAALEAAAGADGGCQYSVYLDAQKIEKLVYSMVKSTPPRLRRVIDTCAKTFSFQ